MTEKSESGIDQEGSTARTESRASNLIADAFGEMPTRRTVVARLLLLGALVLLSLWCVLLMAVYTRAMLWMVK